MSLFVEHEEGIAVIKGSFQIDLFCDDVVHGDNKGIKIIYRKSEDIYLYIENGAEVCTEILEREMEGKNSYLLVIPAKEVIDDRGAYKRVGIISDNSKDLK